MLGRIFVRRDAVISQPFPATDCLKSQSSSSPCGGWKRLVSIPLQPSSRRLCCCFLLFFGVLFRVKTERDPSVEKRVFLLTSFNGVKKLCGYGIVRHLFGVSFRFLKEREGNCWSEFLQPLQKG